MMLMEHTTCGRHVSATLLVMTSSGPQFFAVTMTAKDAHCFTPRQVQQKFIEKITELAKEKGATFGDVIRAIETEDHPLERRKAT